MMHVDAFGVAPQFPNLSVSLQPCLHSTPRTGSTSSRSTSACSRTSRTGSSVMISLRPADLPSVLSSTATGTCAFAGLGSRGVPCSHPHRLFGGFFFVSVCRNVQDPRALAAILEKAEADLAAKQHPDPYIRTCLCVLQLRLGLYLYYSGDGSWWYQMGT